jgi:acyl-CoA thioester hydrolase
MRRGNGTFAVRISARSYETDSNGHVAGTAILQYGQHARWECTRAAGIDQRKLLDVGVGPVSLEERIRFHSELHAGDEVDVTCRFVRSGGMTFRVEQELRKSDGSIAADVTGVAGLLDLEARRLVPDPAAVWRSLATAPELLGL